MTSLDDLTEQFGTLGIEISEDAMAKCIDLCITYDINAEEFVEQWVAYSVSNLGGAEPTLDYLADMERKELANRKAKLASNKKSKSYNSSLNRYDESRSPGLHGGPSMDVEDDDDIMDSYVCKTPKTTKPKVARTPHALQKNVLFSPASHSPLSGTPRSPLPEISGKPCYTFGKVAGQQWKSVSSQKIEIKQSLLHNNNESLDSKAKYMFDTLLDKSIIMGDHLYPTATEICKKHFDCDPIDYDLCPADVISQDTIKIIGRICSEYDEKLDRNSAFLIGTDELKLRMTRLCFDHVKCFSVFPGQTVIVSGTNPRGETFYVDGIFAERELATPKLPELEEALSFVIATGPFTGEEDLVYEPLQDLILYCKDNKPDVLILAGPFVDAQHNLIVTNTLSESFDAYFEKMIAGLVEAIGSDIPICLIASQKDVIGQVVYPTPPYVLKRNYSNVHPLPDPSIIDINGLKIGITSTDILGHILDQELAINAGDKIKRVANYMLHQGSFYPLSPPALDVSYDSELASKFANLHELPNILILPSKERYFLREINNCLVVNPGYLTTKSTSGTFARVVVRPPGESSKLADYIAGQIIKI